MIALLRVDDNTIEGAEVVDGIATNSIPHVDTMVYGKPDTPTTCYFLCIGDDHTLFFWGRVKKF